MTVTLGLRTRQGAGEDKGHSKREPGGDGGRQRVGFKVEPGASIGPGVGG